MRFMEKYAKTGIIIEKKKTMLKQKIVLIGFPGMALVGKGVAEYLINALGLELEVVMHPIHSPANVVVDNGLIITPSINIYSKRDVDIAVVTSSFQPQTDEGQNIVAHFVLEYLANKKVLSIISAAAYVTSNPSKPRKVYVASTHREFLRRLLDIGLSPMEGGISGLNGLIPGLSYMYGLPGAVLLGETGEIYVAGNLMDYLAVASVLEAISKIANIELDTRELFRKGEELEEKITTQALREIETEEKPSAPTHL